MTLDEARAVARVIGTADNGCSTCVENLCRRMNDAFPAFVWTATEEPLEEPLDWDPEDIVKIGLIVDVRASA